MPTSEKTGKAKPGEQANGKLATFEVPKLIKTSLIERESIIGRSQVGQIKFQEVATSTLMMVFTDVV